ncbi:helix-turn-helix domain-containing protein [Actinophytocola sp. NPDC049390]|uniref:helix-turn-helix domain-containing protein n=1 Tax=Actinophytocola sp. NPDC049390 TaxID=3363894 RepID=UPI0037931648
MNYETQRLEFGDRLAALRTQADLKQKELAAALGWDPTKVSKLEHGKQLPNDRDLTDWLRITDADDHLDTMRDHLRRLRIAHGAWRRQVRGGHRARQKQDAREESAASVIRAVDIMAVPGLLQIADYARAVFLSQAELLGTSADDVDEAVRARLQRSQILYEPRRTIEILIAESALSTAVCPPNVMVAQLDRLTTVVGLPGVRFGILPAYQQLPHLVPTGFWIVDNEVFVEHPAGELRIDDEDQVSTYNKLTDRLWTAAHEGDKALPIIAENRHRWADVSDE